MLSGNFVFSQIMDHLPWPVFHQCVAYYSGDKYIKTFSCSEQYRCMDFAQLTYRSSLRDIEICLRFQGNKLYHMGIRRGVSCNNLANAVQSRDWRIYADFTQSLIRIVRNLHVDDALSGIDIDDSIYALDSTNIDLCYSLFPGHNFVRKRGLSRCILFSLYTEHSDFTTFFNGKLIDVNILDILPLEAGAFYIMDRAYLDFERLYRMSLCGSFFVLRAKSNTKLRRLRSNPLDRSIGLFCDQIVKPNSIKTKARYPENLRRIKYQRF